MPCAFKPCPLEINNNGGLKREHLESSPSATKNTTTIPMATKLGRRITYLDRLLSIKSHNPLSMWSCEIT